MTVSPIDVVVLASGRGSNLRALSDAIDGGRCHARIAAVVSDRASAPALELAAGRGLATELVPFRGRAERPRWDVELLETVRKHDPALVVLAGFMRIVGTPLIQYYARHIINVHPSLLPAFPGAHACAEAVERGVRISGCTVHVVDERVDAGPIIAQAAVPVHPQDDAESLHDRIRPREHRLLPDVIDRIATGDLSLSPLRLDGPVSIPDEALVSPSFLEREP